MNDTQQVKSKRKETPVTTGLLFVEAGGVRDVVTKAVPISCIDGLGPIAFAVPTHAHHLAESWNAMLGVADPVEAMNAAREAMASTLEHNIDDGLRAEVAVALAQLNGGKP